MQFSLCPNGCHDVALRWWRDYPEAIAEEAWPHTYNEAHEGLVDWGQGRQCARGPRCATAVWNREVSILPVHLDLLGAHNVWHTASAGSVTYDRGAESTQMSSPGKGVGGQETNISPFCRLAGGGDKMDGDQEWRGGVCSVRAG